MKRIVILIPLVAAIVLLLVPASLEGRGRAGLGAGRGARAEGGSGGGSSDSGSGSEAAPPTPPPEMGNTPSEELKSSAAKDAPKDPEDALHAEIDQHIQLTLRECLHERHWVRLRQSFDDGRWQVNFRAGACPQAEHPAEDESAEEDGEAVGTPNEE